MARILEKKVISLVSQVLEAKIDPSTPEWLKRPGRIESRASWSLVCKLYKALEDSGLPEVMPLGEWRKVDAIIRVNDNSWRVLEFDEKQHFNRYRAETLCIYAANVPLAFPASAWLEQSMAKRRLEQGNFARPRPPLFPGLNGRHRQRAFRDALCDILPLEHGFGPTLRIADFEVRDWIDAPNAASRMRDFLAKRLATAPTSSGHTAEACGGAPSVAS